MFWKDVVGYEGIYEVSEDGQIRTHKDKITFSELHGKRTWKQRILKQKISKDNSYRVSLYKDKKEKTWLVHRLVAMAFIPMIEGKICINHIDGNRLNNHVKNLEWCNHLENNNHAFDNKLIHTCHEIILTNKETKEIHRFRSKAKASYFFNRQHSFISRLIKDGKSEYKDYKIEVVL